jgi:hypothetical protein
MSMECVSLKTSLLVLFVTIDVSAMFAKDQACSYPKRVAERSLF